MLSVYSIVGMMKDSFYFPQSYLMSKTDMFLKFDEKFKIHEDIKFTNFGGFFWMKKR